MTLLPPLSRLQLGATYSLVWTGIIRLHSDQNATVTACSIRACSCSDQGVARLQVRKEYVEDPLNFVGPVRVRTARKIEAAMTALKKRYSEITVPVFGQHGSMDKCTSIRAHRAFMEGISSADKTLSLVEGGYHELLMGPQKDKCMATIADWILQRSTPQFVTPL